MMDGGTEHRAPAVVAPRGVDATIDVLRGCHPEPAATPPRPHRPEQVPPSGVQTCTMTPTGRDPTDELTTTTRATPGTTDAPAACRPAPPRPAPTGVETRSQRPPPAHERSTISMDWRDRAACLDEGPELFFPIGNTGPAILQIEEAKAVCRRCDVHRHLPQVGPRVRARTPASGAACPRTSAAPSSAATPARAAPAEPPHPARPPARRPLLGAAVGGSVLRRR